MSDQEPSKAEEILKEGKQDDSSKPEVQKFLRLMSTWQTTYLHHFNTLDIIQREFLDTYSVIDPRKVPRKIAGWILHMALYKTRKQWKPMDFTLFSAAATPDERLIQQGLLEDALEKSGYSRTEVYGFGGIDRQILFGEHYKGFGPTPNQKFPFGYWTQEASRQMFNVDANVLRNPGAEREARQSMSIKEYSAETALKIAPQIAGKATLGLLPMFQENRGKKRDMTTEQDAAAKKGIIQFGYCNDIDERFYQVICGSGAHQTLVAKDALYPFVNSSGDSYINVSHKVTFTNPEGMPNYGLGHLLYRLNILERVLVNKGITYTIDNSNPLRVVTVGTGKEKDWLRQVRKARRSQKKGEVGVIWNKDGADFKGIDTLRTDVIIEEMNGMLKIINEQIIIPLGINLRDMNTDPAKTFGAIELEAENTSQFVRDIQSSNADETKFEIEQLIDYCKQHVKDDNDIPLRSKRTVVSPETGKPIEVNGPPGADTFTLGDMAKTFRAKEWEIVMNEDSGVRTPRSLDIARHERILNRLIPGSPAWAKKMQSLSKLEGEEMELEDFAPQAQEAPVEAKVVEEPF